jgi:hypothetical protein
VSSPAPLDARRRAFADALGRLLAEVVWREITDQTPETPRPARPENHRRDVAIEVESASEAYAPV